MNLVSPTAFDYILSAAVGVVAAIWFVYDARNLLRLRRADRSDPKVGDKRFGYTIGLLIGAIGVIGVLAHHFGHLGHHVG